MIEKQSTTHYGTEFVIRSHPYSPNHAAVIITTKKGESFGSGWAIEKDEEGNIVSPTLDQVKTAWRNERHKFDRYKPNSF